MADPTSPTKALSQRITFKAAEIWISNERVVVDSKVPLPDLKLREFARPRVFFESACYYVSQKRVTNDKPPLYRYVLTPWPKSDESITEEVVLNAEYFERVAAERLHERVERKATNVLLIFYPFLGFLWSPQKRVLNRMGIEAHSISSVSVAVGFGLGLLCGGLLAAYEIGAGRFSVWLGVAMIAFMLDAAVRFNRQLSGADQVPPGFFEWLVRRRVTYE